MPDPQASRRRILGVLLQFDIAESVNDSKLLSTQLHPRPLGVAVALMAGVSRALKIVEANVT